MPTSVRKRWMPPLPGSPIDADTPFVPKHWWDPSKVATATISRYADNLIDLHIGIPQVNIEVYYRFIDLNTIRDDDRELVRAFVWCGMNLDHAGLVGGHEPIPPARLKKDLHILRRYLTFMAERGVTLETATDADNDAWMAQFDGQSYTSRSRASAIPWRLHWYRLYLPVKIPERQPWVDRTVVELLGHAPRLDENTTERVPRHIIEPMMRWALFYVDVAAGDILTLLQHVPKPLHNTSVRSVAKGFKFATLPGTQVPWNTVRACAPFREIRNITIACYIVTAYLSGMRDGEIQTIRRGQWGVKYDEHGVAYRWWVRAKEFKRDGKGKERTWIVIPEVHRALEVLAELADVMAQLQPDEPGLMNGQLLFRRFVGIGPRGPWSTRSAALETRMTTWINKFQKYLSVSARRATAAACAGDDRNVIQNLFCIPPGPEGDPWRWMVRQFRRTIAWYIATEPFGTVAGMRQFGQIREVTFQGYAGSPEGEFRDEIERMRAIGQMRDILDMYEDVQQGARLGGPTGARLEKEFALIAEQLPNLPGKVVDEARLLGMLKNVAKVVYPGLINDCFFDAATALCLKKAGRETDERPLFAQCDWDKCPNSCFWRKHRAALKLSLDEALAQRSLPKLAKNQRLALDIIIAKYQDALARIGDGD
jgi:integrase